MESLEGDDLGTFDTTAGQTLVITGAVGRTYKNLGSNVTGVRFHYSVAAAGEAHSFTVEELGWTADLNNGNGDQEWGSATWAPVDLLAGLSSGSYELQVFMSGQSDTDPEFFRDNRFNGVPRNYTATFTVVPEPSSAALLGLGGLALILRRRK